MLVDTAQRLQILVQGFSPYALRKATGPPKGENGIAQVLAAQV